MLLKKSNKHLTRGEEEEDSFHLMAVSSLPFAQRMQWRRRHSTSFVSHPPRPSFSQTQRLGIFTAPFPFHTTRVKRKSRSSPFLTWWHRGKKGREWKLIIIAHFHFFCSPRGFLWYHFCTHEAPRSFDATTIVKLIWKFLLREICTLVHDWSKKTYCHRLSRKKPPGGNTRPPSPDN